MAQREKGEALATEARAMRATVAALAELEEMGLAALRERYRELYGEEARSKNLPYLRKKLAFRIQERAEGGLSPRARARLVEIGPAELPVKVAPKRTVPAPRPVEARVPAKDRDARLPEAGTVLVREHNGLAHEVEVRAESFRYRGKDYRSLSAIAKEITGTAWNGFLFFGLTERGSHGR
ncbi:MAG: DUF2924 domain-containing protein [Acidobacteria bacterium]|nr:DUF2924 domain-containing protein [Acidobacteriota bacterium]